MKVETKACGTIEIDELQKITFSMGVYGFEDLKDFVLFDAKQPPFYWLQSLEDQNIAFVLLDPLLIRPEYDPCLDPIDLEALDLSGTDDPRMIQFAIVTVPSDHSEMTANLQGPLVINKENRLGRQCISGDDRYQVKHNILAELATCAAQNAC